MTPDEHNACPACPTQVRALYAVGRRALARLSDLSVDPNPEYQELYQALEDLRPLVEAHYANQLHALSKELAGARLPTVTVGETPRFAGLPGSLRQDPA